MLQHPSLIVRHIFLPYLLSYMSFNNSRGLLMGVDIGTTRIKCVVVDGETGDVLETNSVRMPVRTRGETSEFDVDMVWEKTLECLSSLKLKDNVKVVGLSGQSPSLVLLGSDGRPVYKGISWSDKRAVNQVAASKPHKGLLLNTTGLHPDPIFVLFKLVWVKENIPRVYEKARLALQVKDYIFYKLTGEPLTDHSSASETMLYDLRKGWWSEDIARIFGVDLSMLPDIVESETVVEPKKPAPVLTSGTLVCIGGVDSLMSAFGCGSDEANPSVSAGTSICVNITLDSLDMGFVNKGFEVYRHVERGKWTAECSTPSGGMFLDWVKELLGYPSLDEMFRDALRSPPGANGVIVEPYVIGSRCPSWSRRRASFKNLGVSSRRSDLARAALESLSAWVALSLSKSGRSLESLVFSGGLTRSPLPSIVSDLVGRPVHVFKGESAEAYGAALLGGVSHLGLDKAQVKRLARGRCELVGGLGLSPGEINKILNEYKLVLGFNG